MKHPFSARALASCCANDGQVFGMAGARGRLIAPCWRIAHTLGPKRRNPENLEGMT
jgi:hypothetical protein